MDVADFVDAVRRVAGRRHGARPGGRRAALLGRRAQGPLDGLTPRELEVLALMAEGRSNAAIAETLVLTVGAVEKHIASIFTKLRAAAVRRPTTGASSPCSRTCSRTESQLKLLRLPGSLYGVPQYRLQEAA